eukprot:Rmarinus@m.23896
MARHLFVFAAAAAIQAATSIPLGGGVAELANPYVGETDWDRLDVTWPKYSGLPVTSSEAVRKGWEVFQTCADGALGNTYWKDGDISSMPFFDQNGNLAGITTGTPRRAIWPGADKAPFEAHPADDKVSEEWMSISAYFVNPDSVCGSAPRLADEIGDRLWIVNGQRGDYLKIPLDQDESLLSQDGWTYGKCFWTMGEHYWKDITKETQPDEFFPIFVMYNGGRLDSWGPAFAGTYNLESSRWEHPSGSVLKAFFQEETMPEVLLELDYLNTQHIYMDKGAFNFC